MRVPRSSTASIHHPIRQRRNAAGCAFAAPNPSVIVALLLRSAEATLDDEGFKRKRVRVEAEATSALRNWLTQNPRAPAAWRTIAARLADDLDMPKVWRRLGGKNAFAVFAAACDAADKARAEASRRPCEEETLGLQRVIDAANKFNDAIERSPLPRQSAVLIQLADGDKPVPIWLGWRDAPANLGPSMSLTEFLPLVADLVRQHQVQLPTRAVRRARGNPEVSAFVRWLNWFLATRSISHTPTQLATIANAALALHEDALTESGVRAILRDMPNQFRT